jgi:transcription initiation factor TFIID subunit 2
MPGLIDTSSTPGASASDLGFSVLSQRVHIDIDFERRSLRGKTEITLQPHFKELRTIKLNCRQCVLTRLSVEGKSASLTYQDPYARMNPHASLGVHQHHLLRKKVEGQLRNPPEEELVITLPKSVHIKELDPFSEAAQVLMQPNLAAKKAEGQGPMYSLIKINVEYLIENPKHGVHFVGLDAGDPRFPHVYTRNCAYPGAACCLFPCVDNPSARCSWEISVRCPRTLGDAFGANPVVNSGEPHNSGSNGRSTQASRQLADVILTEEEKSLDLTVVCSGDMTDEVSPSCAFIETGVNSFR